MSYSDYCIDLLSSLVAISSESQQESAIAQFLYEWLRDMGVESTLHQLSKTTFNVYGCLKGNRTGNSNRKVIIGGHIDTVPIFPNWTTDPLSLTQVGNNLYGVGAGDMKGGIAALITAMKMLIDKGRDFVGTLEFVGLCDEERFSDGAKLYSKLEQRWHGASLAIFAEPHYDEIVVGAPGKSLIECMVTGKPGHAALPMSGINAIDCACKMLYFLLQEYQDVNFSDAFGSFCTLSIDSRNNGYSLSIPAECQILINKQIGLNENISSFITKIENIYSRFVGRGLISVNAIEPKYQPYLLDVSNPDLMKLLGIIEGRSGRVPKLIVNNGVSDANIFVGDLKIPTVLYGPKGVDIHKPNEYVEKSSLISYAQTVADFIETL